MFDNMIFYSLQAYLFYTCHAFICILMLINTYVISFSFRQKLLITSFFCDIQIVYERWCIQTIVIHPPSVHVYSKFRML